MGCPAKRDKIKLPGQNGHIKYQDQTEDLYFLSGQEGKFIGKHQIFFMMFDIFLKTQQTWALTTTPNNNGIVPSNRGYQHTIAHLSGIADRDLTKLFVEMK